LASFLSVNEHRMVAENVVKWYKSCPACNQGRLVVMHDTTNQRLYLHCEECETGFLNPNNTVKGGGFLTLLESFDAEPATDAEIKDDSVFSGLPLLEYKQ
jgi:hypothetical protein